MRRIILSILAGAALVLAGAAPAEGSHPEALVLYKGKLRAVGGENTSQALLANPTVFDGTPSTSNWKIAEAVSEWNRKSAFEATMSTSETANVRVYEKTWQEVNAMCNYTGPGEVLGCHDNGLIWLNRDYRTQPMAEHVGGHELGHAFGHPHVAGVKSWMLPQVNADTWLRAPQSYDYSIQQQLYGN